MASAQKQFAIVTGGSSGIGLELARLAARDGYDLLLAADDPAIEQVGKELEALGVRVETLQADLSTSEGVDALHARAMASGRPIDVLFANAGHGLGHGFLDQDFCDIMHVINTNIVGTVHLVHKVGNGMRRRGSGKILFTGSIAGIMPGTFQAVYNGSKAFVDNFAYALRNELKDTGVSVTVLMPGPTDTNFFERADMTDTKVGAGKKDDPADVAKTGYDALMRGEASVVHGLKNKMDASMANILPKTVGAEQHRKMAEPGSGLKS
jgi:short-subunit dehydrogenase